MKKVVFICSHLFSGSSVLYDSLCEHPRIQGYKHGIPNRYETTQNFFTLVGQPHKVDNKSAIFMDELLYNHQFSCENLYKVCKFIFIIRDPIASLNSMLFIDKVKPEYAVAYYNFRMRRLCEMARRTPKALILTYENLLKGEGLDVIQEYLQTPFKITFNPSDLSHLQKTSIVDMLEPSLRLEVSDKFERYLYFLKNQSLRWMK